MLSGVASVYHECVLMRGEDKIFRRDSESCGCYGVQCSTLPLFYCTISTTDSVCTCVNVASNMLSQQPSMTQLLEIIECWISFSIKIMISFGKIRMSQIDSSNVKPDMINTFQSSNVVIWIALYGKFCDIDYDVFLSIRKIALRNMKSIDFRLYSWLFAVIYWVVDFLPEKLALCFLCALLLFYNELPCLAHVFSFILIFLISFDRPLLWALFFFAARFSLDKVTTIFYR